MSWGVYLKVYTYEESWMFAVPVKSEMLAVHVKFVCRFLHPGSDLHPDPRSSDVDLKHCLKEIKDMKKVWNVYPRIKV